MHTLRLLVLWALSVVWLDSAWAGRCPNVGIILDRSASMAQTPDGTAPSPTNPTKWTIATKAVSDIVTRNDGKFPMGLVYFPSTSGSGVCGASASFDIPIGYGQKSAIMSSLGTVMPSGNTPTGDAINYAINDQVFLDTARKQYLILITDGKPCCMPGCTDASILAFDAVNAVKLARGRKVEIQTFVIGFGKLAFSIMQPLIPLRGRVPGQYELVLSWRPGGAACRAWMKSAAAESHTSGAASAVRAAPLASWKSRKWVGVPSGG